MFLEGPQPSTIRRAPCLPSLPSADRRSCGLSPFRPPAGARCGAASTPLHRGTLRKDRPPYPFGARRATCLRGIAQAVGVWGDLANPSAMNRSLMGALGRLLDSCAGRGVMWFITLGGVLPKEKPARSGQREELRRKREDGITSPAWLRGWLHRHRLKRGTRPASRTQALECRHRHSRSQLPACAT